MPPFSFWQYENEEDQRKRHAADFSERAAEISQRVQQSQLQEHVGGLLERIRKPVEDVWNAAPSLSEAATGAQQTARAATSWMDPVLDPAAELLGVNERDRRRSEMQTLLDRQPAPAPGATAWEQLRGQRSAVGGVTTAPQDLPETAAPEDRSRYRELYDQDMLGSFDGVGGGVKFAGAVFGAAAKAAQSPAVKKVAQSYGTQYSAGGANLNLKKTIYNIFDDLAPVRDVMDRVSKQLGRSLADDENAYQLLRLGRASNEIGDAWYRQHVGDTLGGLERISGSVGQGRDDLSVYLRAVDAIDKDAVRPGRSYGGFKAAEAQQALLDLQGRLGAQQYAALEQAAGQFHKLGHFLLQKKVDAGLVDPTLAADLMQKYPRYMPIQIIDWLDDNLARTASQVGKVGGGANDIKKLTDLGTDRVAEDPLQAYYRMAQRTAMLEAKNRAGNAIVNAAKMDPALSQLVRPVTHGVQRRPGEEVLQVLNNGQIEKYYIDRALKPLVDFGVNNGDDMMKNLFGKAANVTRKMAIAYNPVWGAGQLVMDSLTYILKEGGLFNAHKSVRDLGRGGKAVVEKVLTGKSALYDEAAGAGALPGSVEFVSGKPGSYEKVVQGMTGRDVTNPQEFAGWMKDRLLGGLKGINESFDAVPRLAEYSRVKGAGGTQAKAALAARDVTIDPNRGGHIIRQWNAVIPFYNVAFQGAAYAPRLLSSKDPAVQAKALLGLTTGAVMPAMALEYYNLQDPRYKDVPDYDKDRGLIIMGPGKGKIDPVTGQEKPDYFLIRTGPFTPFALLGRAMARQALTGENDWGKTAMGVVKGTSPLDVSNPVDAFQSGEDMATGLTRAGMSVFPAGLKQAAELYGNYDSFRDRPIVPKGLENELPERQFTENTSETAKMLAPMFGIAPARLDYLLRSWGGAADALVGISDFALDATGVAEKGESQRLGKLRRDLAKTGISEEEKSRLEGEIAREMLIKADREGALKNTPVVGGLLSRYYREQGGQSIEDRVKAVDRALTDKKRGNDAVSKELARLGNNFSDVKDEIGGVKLTRSQAVTYREKALDYRNKLLTAVMADDLYKKADDKEKVRLVRDAMTRAAGWASQEILPGRSDVGQEFSSVGGIDKAVAGYVKAKQQEGEYREMARSERFRNIDPDEYDEVLQDIGELQKLKSALGDTEGEIVFLEKYGEMRFARAATAREGRRWRERAERFRRDNPEYGIFIDSASRVITRRGLDAAAVAKLAGL